MRLPIVSEFVEKVKKLSSLMIYKKSLVRSIGPILAPLAGRLL